MASLDACINNQFRLYQNIKEREGILRTSKTLLTVRQNKKAKKRLSVFIPWLEGSFTLEASLILTILLLTLYGFWYLFLIFHVQVVIQAALEQTAQQAAVYAYVGDKAALGFGAGSEWADALGEFAKWGIEVQGLKHGVLTTAVRDAVDNSCIDGGSGGISFTESKILQEEGIVDVVVRYKVSVPIGIPGLQKLSFVQRSRRHAWVGERQETDFGGVQEEKGIKLYKTETGTVYHLYEDCSHIKLSVQMVSAGDLPKCRNENGGKYYPCERCNRSGSCEGTVYITEDGDRYHISLGCSGLKRKVTAVWVESVSDVPICSRCRQRQGAE